LSYLRGEEALVKRGKRNRWKKITVAGGIALAAVAVLMVIGLVAGGGGFAANGKTEEQHRG
jgi:hypothetical protein